MSDDNNSQILLLIESRVKDMENVKDDIFYHLFEIYKKIHGEKYCQDDILKRVRQRMAIGMERYGHGIRVEDDTRKWGTETNSWLEMCEEEMLDGIVYTAAHFIREQDCEQD